MSNNVDLRTAMRQEQYKRGLLKSSKRGSSSSKPKPDDTHGAQLPTEEKTSTAEEEQSAAATSALPAGFFDDATAQSKVEDNLKKQQELERLEEASRQAKSMAEKDLELTQKEEVETKASVGAEEGDMDRDLAELQAFTKAIEAKANPVEEVKEDAGVSKGKGDSFKDSEPVITMTDDAVTATSEEAVMDKYADRMIKIVKRSLNQQDTAANGEDDVIEDTGLKEMESKLRQGMRRKRKLEEAEMEGFENPW